MKTSAARRKKSTSKKHSQRSKRKGAGRSKPAQPPNALCKTTEDAVITAAKELPSDRPLTKAEDRSFLRRVEEHVVALFAAHALKEGGKKAIELAKEYLPGLLDKL